jgi:DNA-binding transcriptional regulator YiaG
MSTEIVGYDENICYNPFMITPEQSRAARGWLEWSQEDLAKRANTSLSTVRDFEKGRRAPIKNNLEAIRLSFELAGVSFIFRGEIPLGIQVNQREAP